MPKIVPFKGDCSHLFEITSTPRAAQTVSAEVFYVNEQDATAVVRVIRIGSLQGSCSVPLGQEKKRPVFAIRGGSYVDPMPKSE